MRAVRLSFIQMLRMIKRDMILFVACFAPLLCGVTFKFGIPALEKILINYFDKSSILGDYYGMFDLFFAILSSVMFCFVAAMVILEETDDHIAGYLFVTPLGKKGYLFSRLAIPSLIGFLVNLIFLPIFKLSDMSIPFMLMTAAAGAAQGLVSAMLIVSFSSNKLEGMAVTKLSSLMVLGFAVPYLLSDNIQYILFFLPSFWMAKAVREDNLLLMLLSVFTAFVWCSCLLKRFQKKTEK